MNSPEVRYLLQIVLVRRVLGLAEVFVLYVCSSSSLSKSHISWNCVDHKPCVGVLLKCLFSLCVQFEQFVAYLRQRDRAGVVKVPATERLWQRMLYILPWSADICAMLEISQQPTSCLISLILPAPTCMSSN
jgi:hypothetical protein